MLASAIIVFRETIEAGLIVGIVLAVTRQMPFSAAWIGGGVAFGVLGSCVVAAFTGVLAAAFAGSGQELFNAAILSLAVVMLAWHNLWMSRHGRELASRLRSVGEAASSGASSMLTLAVVVGVAVLREGSEVALFLYGVAVSDNSSSAALLAGGFLGLAVGAAVAGLAFAGLLKIPARHLFAVTSALIAFMAAGMAAQALAFLEQAGWVTVLQDSLWDTSAFLSDRSIPGRMLHTLLGYVDRPSVIQFLTYLLVLGGLLLAPRLFPAAPARAKFAPPRAA